MILASLADLGVSVGELEAALQALPVEALTLRSEPAGSHGLHGTRVTVQTPEHGHHHRGLAAIRGLIEQSSLPGPVKETSQRVFQRLGEAEAEVHATSIERIHFHEVGAMDSIADILGSCLGLHHLRVDSVSVGPLPVGCGTVSCAHGRYPVPVPATVLLLKGHPLVHTDEPYELVTPTGAALLSTWKRADQSPPGSRIRRVGYGFGRRELKGRPNALRALLLDTTEPAGQDTCLVLETEIDDAVPELLGVLSAKLLEHGALDVFTTAVQMKRQRPGALLTVLCRPEDRAAMLDLIFRESTTFGVREYTARRTVLERRVVPVPTPFGTVRVKVGSWQGEEITRSPEMRDCIEKAAAAGLPVRAVYEAACRAASPAPSCHGDHE
jgi:uncharacterized protein (TIGR00299 family) protein